MNSTTSDSSPAESGDSLAAATDAATKAWETTQDKAREALQTGERYVRENPGTSAFSIFGLGVVAGLLVGYSLAHEDRDDYAASARKFMKRWGHKLKID